jgi:hypothetical protein
VAERKTFLLRLDPALYAALEAWARQELRSVNGQIEFLLKEAVRRRDKRPYEQDEASASRGATPP